MFGTGTDRGAFLALPHHKFDHKSDDASGHAQRGRPADLDWDGIANLAEQGLESLVECALRQIDLAIFEPRRRVIAYALAEALEPEGVFARDPTECLRIQARERGELDGTMAVVPDHLEMSANGDIAALARRLRLIREKNPKQGEAYESAPLRVHAPDVIVSRGKDGWIVDLNRSTLPSLAINEDYAAQITATGRGKAAEAGNQFVTDAVGSARRLRRALEQRNSTTLKKIADEIIRQQSAFLSEGLSALRPPALKDVAEAVGMHESTVSRVTSGLLMATPKGCYPLKSLFGVSLVTGEGDAKTAAAVRNMIQAIIEDEPAGKPLSDDVIAVMVSEKGVELARRTVAKYRDMPKIPSSSERRRRARLAMAG